MRTSIGAPLCLALAALAGCSSTAVFIDPTAPTREAFGAALEDAADAEVLRYQVGLDSLGGNLAQRTVDVVAFDDGIAFGTFTEKKTADSEIVSDGENVFARTTTSFWKDGGGADEEFDDEWVKVDPETWFEPGSQLTPENVFETLIGQFDKHDTLRITLPATLQYDGVSAYAIPTMGGKTIITSEKPHRLLAVEDVQVSIANPQTRARTAMSLTVIPTAPDDPALDEIRERTADALDELETPFDLTASVDVTSDDDDFDCDQSFSCTVAIEAEVNVYGESSDRAMVVLEATSKAAALGEKTCRSTKVVKSGEKKALSCTVQFTPTPGSHQIQAEWTTAAYAVLDYDGEALAESFATAFGR